MSRPSDLIQGTLDLLILRTLSLKPKHGWAIAKRIQQSSGEVLQVTQGALYPALHRLVTVQVPWSILLDKSDAIGYRMVDEDAARRPAVERLGT
jgi:hypothetical protein